MNKINFSILTLIFLAACSDTPKDCAKNDRQCLTNRLKAHVTKTLPYWKPYLAKPLEQRVYIAPTEVIEYLTLDNQRNGFPERPKPATPTKAFLSDFEQALKEIPNPIKNLVNDKLVGIFLVNDLGGSGFTDYIYNQGNAASTFIILDAGVLKNFTANEWASWKEQTPFIADDRYKLEAMIEDPANNNRKQAIQYILLHEFAHVISLNEFIHPPWSSTANQVTQAEDYSFFNLSWLINEQENRYTSIYDSTTLPERSNIIYYFGAKLEADQMVNLYTRLEQTNFPTLYAATSFGDDWAESFVTYVHSVVMKKPFQIKIKKGGQIEKTYGLCWGKLRCSEKEAILKAFLSNHSQAQY